MLSYREVVEEAEVFGQNTDAALDLKRMCGDIKPADGGRAAFDGKRTSTAEWLAVPKRWPHLTNGRYTDEWFDLGYALRNINVRNGAIRKRPRPRGHARAGCYGGLAPACQKKGAIPYLTNHGLASARMFERSEHARNRPYHKLDIGQRPLVCPVQTFAIWNMQPSLAIRVDL